MLKISQKISKRLSEGIKNFQPVLKAANSRDVNESDTSTIVTDMLSDIWGYDKYSEITSEFMIRSTYCDLAVVINGKPNIIIEVKAIGLELKDNHIKQAVDYACNQGIDWVVLTNSIEWKLYKVLYNKPIEHELVFEFNFMELSSKKKKDVEFLFPLTREGVAKSTLEDYHDQKQALSRFTLGALILSDHYLTSIRKDLRKLAPGINIELDEIKDVITNELFKREVIESGDIKTAEKKVKKLEQKPRSKTTPVKEKIPPSNSVAAVSALLVQSNTNNTLN